LMRMVRIQIDNTVWCFKRSHTCKKRLKILKGYSEAVMRRKAENEIDNFLQIVFFGPFLLFRLSISFSAFLRITASEYPFSIFNRFLHVWDLLKHHTVLSICIRTILINIFLVEFTTSFHFLCKKKI
jgi:uncharacterized membrane protein YcgQ (UPF0703/DUF1980 family)